MLYIKKKNPDLARADLRRYQMLGGKLEAGLLRFIKR
jgi:hypothetical protein